MGWLVLNQRRYFASQRLSLFIVIPAVNPYGRVDAEPSCIDIVSNVFREVQFPFQNCNSSAGVDHPPAANGTSDFTLNNDDDVDPV